MTWQRDYQTETQVQQLLDSERWSEFDEYEEMPARPAPDRKRKGNGKTSAAASPQTPHPDDGNTIGNPIENEGGEEEGTGPLAGFFAEELIVGEPVVVKSGKEASVYCCRAHPRLQLETEWLAAKVYRSRQNRSFQNDAVYMQGRTTLNRRLDKAIAQKSHKGRTVQFGMWIGAEFETLRRLHEAGADVPKPYASGESALLLEYFGEIGMSAPQLQNVQIAREEAPILFAQLQRNLAIFLECDRVHGDLSPYNILYWQGKLQIIDFPQAVDPMDNPDAYALFARDVAHVCAYFAPYGIDADPKRMAFALWMDSGRPRPKQV